MYLSDSYLIDIDLVEALLKDWRVIIHIGHKYNNAEAHLATKTQSLIKLLIFVLLLFITNI